MSLNGGTTMEFKIGDKVCFNEATKEKYKMWIDDKYTHCGRQKFCKELKECGLNTIFTITDIDEENWGKKDSCVFESYGRLVF